MIKSDAAKENWGWSLEDTHSIPSLRWELVQTVVSANHLEVNLTEFPGENTWEAFWHRNLNAIDNWNREGRESQTFQQKNPTPLGRGPKNLVWPRFLRMSWANLFWLVVSTHLKNISQNGNLSQVGVIFFFFGNRHLVFVQQCVQTTVPNSINT